MKSKYRILAALFSLLLICIPGSAEETSIAQDAAIAAEPIPAETIEPMPEVEDLPLELPLIEAEMEPLPAEESAEAETPVLPELTLPPVEIQINELAGVASGSGYSYGYAKLILPTTGFASASPDAEATIYLENGVFFVSDRRTSASSDRLRIHFADGRETRSVWVDERRLRPMDADEVLEFVSSSLKKDGVRLYSGDPMLPLDEPDYSSVITYTKAAQEDEQVTPAMFVSRTELSLGVGDVCPIGVSFSDGKGHAVQFTSENESIVSVSEDGRATGIAAGSTRIRIKSEFSNVASIEIQVHE